MAADIAARFGSVQCAAMVKFITDGHPSGISKGCWGKTDGYKNSNHLQGFHLSHKSSMCTVTVCIKTATLSQCLVAPADVGDRKGKEDKPEPEANFALSGKLAAESNTVKGVVLLHQEPPEARKPSQMWRLYGFKNGKWLLCIRVKLQTFLLPVSNQRTDALCRACVDCATTGPHPLLIGYLQV